MCRFRTLCQLGLLALVAAGFAGCGDDDSDRYATYDAQIFLRWEVGYLPVTNAQDPLMEVPCDAVGASKVRLTTYTAEMQAVYAKEWPCNDAQGYTEKLTPGRYFVGVELLDSAGNVLSYTVPSDAFADVVRGRYWDFGAPVELGLQSIPIGWEIYRNNMRQFCSDVGGAEVALILASEASGSLVESAPVRVPCTMATPVGSPVVMGDTTYRVTLQLLDATGAKLAEQRQIVDVPARVRAPAVVFKFMLP